MNEVVVGIDGSDAALHALSWAVFEAERRKMAIRLIGVYQPIVYADGMAVAYVDPDLPRQLRELSEQHLAVAESAVREVNDAIVVTSAAVEGNAAHQLVTACDPTDMLVVGSKSRTGFWNDVIGSTATAVSHHAPCPVMVVPPTASTPNADVVGPITVGVDGSECSQRALEWAYDTARSHGTSLLLVHAWVYPYAAPHGIYEIRGEVRDDAQRLLDSVAEGVASLPGFVDGAVAVETSLAFTSPAEALIALPAPRIVAVGSHGRGGLRSLLLGSVGRSVVEHATEWPVVVVRGARTSS